MDFFLVTILVKGSILDVWQGSEYVNEYCSKTTDELRKALKITGVHWYEMGYVSSTNSCLHFYSTNPCLHFVLQRQFSLLSSFR